jgi:hypothetical protein
MRWNFSLLRDEAGDMGGGGGTPPPAGGSTLLSSGAPGGDGAAPAPAPAPTGWTKDESGAFVEGWHDRFEGDLKGHPSLKVIGSVSDLAKAYVETKKMVGSKLEAPSEKSTPEQVAAFRKIVGAPDKPEGYLGDAKTLRPETVPDGMWDPKAEAAFLAIAHKHHLSPAAVRDIIAHHGESVGQAFQQSAEAEQQHLAGQLSELKKSWGNDFDANLNLASRVAQTVGLDPKTNPIFADAGVVQAFAKLGKMFSETSLVKGEASSSVSGGISTRITEIQDPKSEAIVAREYRGEFGPERQQAAAEMLRGLIKAQSEQK